tara:strand:+ start:576 stop:998 length:423 start_codon:yes stop_codon:yes gene_type:complete
MKSVMVAVLCVLLGGSYVTATQPKEGHQPVEDVFFLASVQFATHLELMHMMLTGDWDEKTYQRFSYYDGLVYQLVKKYEKGNQDDPVWGPAMKRRVELQVRILERMKPLVEKRQAGDRLSDDDRAWLEAANKEVLEKLCK